jgi:hypothetical protein
MVLQDDEYRIKDEGIWISKKALEEFRTQFTSIAKEKGGQPELDISKTDMWYYLGKRDVMIDLLKHFEPLKT